MKEDKILPGTPADESAFVPFRIFNKSERETRAQIAATKENLTEKLNNAEQHIGLLRQAQARNETDIIDLKKESSRMKDGLTQLSSIVDHLAMAVRTSTEKAENFLSIITEQTGTWNRVGQQVMDIKETVDEIKEHLDDYDPKLLSKEINDPDTGLKKRVSNLETTFEHLPWKFAKAIGGVLIGVITGSGALYLLWTKIIWPFFQGLGG